MPQWTNEQLEAIETRGNNLVVSAAAGSGKTAVLVERVCHYLVSLQGDIDRLLVVTFTEAAANEMRQRIAAALRARLAENPADRHLARQLALLPSAHISTIHSFCLWLLRRYFYRLDLDPAFRVMDDGEDRLLKLEVMEALLEEKYQQESADSPFYDLVDRYSDERGENLEDLALALHDFTQSQVFPDLWLQEAAQAFDIPPDTSLEQLRWYQMTREQVVAAMQSANATLKTALHLAAQPGGPEHYHKVLLTDITMLSDLQTTVEKGAWDDAVVAFGNLDFKTARAGKGRSNEEPDDQLLEQVKRLRDQAKKSLRDLAANVYTRNSEQMLADLRSLQAPTRALSGLVAAFSQRYQQAKHARSLVSFADLERFTLQLLLEPVGREQECETSLPADAAASTRTSAESSSPLQPSEIAKELQTHFTEVLCDEYQDINRVQDAILGLLAGEHGCAGAHPDTFMVGDVKQSIYRFRLAEPHIFLNRCQHCDNGAGKLINLAANFRCRRTVVDGVNQLFRLLMSVEVGDVEYDDTAALVFQAKYPPYQGSEAPSGGNPDHNGDKPQPFPEPPVEAIILEGDPRLIDDARTSLLGGQLNKHTDGRVDADVSDVTADTGAERDVDDDADLDRTALEREAAYIARRIHDLVEGDYSEPFLVWDKEQEIYRPVRYRDVVVLLRATHVKATQFTDIFRSEGVPLYAETGSGYFKAPEIETMLALLAVIDNPRQDLPLAGVLRSPLAGLGAAELAEIRLASPEGEFYDALEARAVCDDALGRKLADFLVRLEVWRTRARRSTLADLVWSIYRDTCFYEYCGGMPGGGQRQANLRALYDRARQFDQFARHGLFRFLQFINDLRASGEDLGTAPTLGENEDVVRLMSIHKSKGLEFPVVFVAGLGARFNQQDLYGAFLFDREMGYGPEVIDPALHTRADTLASIGVRECIRRAALSEEMRILYVALTRARERLYLVCTAHDVVTSVERWRQIGSSAAEESHTNAARSPQSTKTAALACGVRVNNAEASHASDESEATFSKVGKLPVYQATSAKRYIDWLGPALAGIDGLLPEVSLSSTIDEPISTETPGWRVTLFPPAAIVREFAQSEPDAPSAADNASPRTLSDRPANPTQLSATQLPSTQSSATQATLAPETVRRLQEQLTWVYPWTGLSEVAARITVTELKRREAQYADPENPAATQHRPPVFRRPVFAQGGGGLSAAEIGTATHLVLQHLPLTEAVTPAVVAACVADLVERAFLTEAEGAAVDQHAITRLFTSSIGVRLLAAAQQGTRQVLRETPFSLAIPAGDLPGMTLAQANSTVGATLNGDTAILQGVVDCMFAESAGWVLLDFKTDRLRAANLEHEATRRYSVQVRWYSKAAAQVLGIHVVECHLCLLSHDITVPIELDSNSDNSQQALA